MATIHKRTLRSGEVVWELTHGTGSDRQRFVVGHTREEAEGALRQFRYQLELHGDAPGQVTVVDAVGKYTTFLRGNRRASTVRRYGRVLRTFTHCFLRVFHPQVQRLRDVRPAHIEDYKLKRTGGELQENVMEDEIEREQQLRNEVATAPVATTRAANARYGWLGRRPFRSKVTPRTVNYELRTLTTFFGWAVKHNHLFANPTAPVERFKIPKRAMPKFLTSDDLKKFFAVCSEDDRRLFLGVLLSGMRKGEVEHLTWEDISFELGVIFIQGKSDLGWQPKTDERLIPMSPMLQEVLLEQYDRRRSDRFVFANREGGIDTHILEKLKKNCRRAGIRQSTVHALRHSFGAHLRMAGVSLADIADLLGHKDLATTQIYAKVHQEHLRKAVAKLTPLVPGNTSREELPRTPDPPSRDGDE